MSEEGRCVLTLPLYVEPWQEVIISKRFAIMEHLKNQLIAMELRKLKNLERTKKYRELIRQIKEASEKDRKALYRLRSKLLKDAGFSEYDFKDDMTRMQKHFVQHIGAHIAHRAASDVWRSFDGYLYKSGRMVHFHKRGTLDSVACQSLSDGMSYKDNTFIWNGGQSREKISLRIRVKPPENAYEREMLTKQLKTMRIVRKWVKTRYKYYLQLSFVGQPVDKNRKRDTGRVGIDIGPQTVAIASKDRVMLLELADKVDRNHREKLRLQRMMDRSKRLSNPQNYNPDGTIRRPPPGKRMQWVYSNRYRKLAGKVRELERKNADIRKYQHTCLANEILSMGDTIYVEKMRFAGLQHRAKETKTDEKGRFLKKKRFGKSLANKAPSMFLLILKTKASQVGASYYEVNTTSFKASQLDHISGQYIPTRLGDRMKSLANGDTVQRDLYSAFLLMNSSDDLQHSNLDLCAENYPSFKQHHDYEIDRIVSTKTKHPASFGF